MRGFTAPSINVRMATVTIVCGLLVAAAGADASGTWHAEKDLADKGYFVTVAVVDGVIYGIGGSSGFDARSDVFAYDPVVGCQPRAAMPTPRTLTAAAVMDRKVYVFGGVVDAQFTATSAAEIYDPAANRWWQVSGAPMPTARWGAVAATVDRKIYVIGGGRGDALGDHEAFSTVEVFNPLADGWETAADMPTARAFAGAAVVDGRIFVVGGIAGGSMSDVVEIYDPLTDSWSTGAPLQVARDCLAVAEVDSKLYVFGGLSFSGAPESHATIVREVEVYDSRVGRWQVATWMPDPRWGLSAAVVEDRVHLLGGARGLSTSGSLRVDAYDPRQFSWWTEVAAHLDGAAGSSWRSEICVVNTGHEAATVELAFHSEAEVVTRHELIAAGQQKSFTDVVGIMGAEGKGTLRVTADQPLRLGGRIFSQGNGGTFGQSCVFHTVEDGFTAGDDAWLVGLHEETGSFRSNLSLANTGIRTSASVVELYDCSGKMLGTFDVILEAGQLEQRVQPLRHDCDTPYQGWAYARIRVISGAGIRISGSVIDERTNDATTIAATY